MIQEEDPILCFNCDAEFNVTSSYDDPIAFCPHCGSEIEGMDDEDTEDLFDDEDRPDPE